MNVRPSMPTTASPILHERDDAIATLTLNRPEARNSLSEAMILALTDALRETARDPDIRAVVIAAHGPVFCAGHDLKELTAHREDADRGRAYYAHVMEICAAMMQAVVRLPQPVIAAVHGTATAAGCQLVASCDLAVAAENAHFATPGVNIGLFCSTPMVALSRNVAPKHAMEMLLTGQPIAAREALRIGLVNRVVPDGTPRDEALRLAKTIVSKSGMTLKVGKEAFYRQLDMSLADAYAYAGKVMVDNMLARDAEEGIGAFIEKRDARWEHR